MAKAQRNLKVFQTRIGFFDSVIAVASQPAALRAWGIHQNLFASGAASAVTDPHIIALAQAQPGIPLKRAIGSNAPFSSAPALPTLPDEPPPKPRARAAKPPVPKPPDRTKLDNAEQHLAELQAEHTTAAAAFERRLRDLQAEQAQAEHTFKTRQASAKAELMRQRDAYRRAGGEDSA